MKFGLMLLCFCIILNPIGQILEKIGMSQVGKISSIGQLLHPETILKLVLNPYVIGGVLISVLSLLFWLGAMSNLSISYMFPLRSISYIVLALLAFLILKEDITMTRWAGIIVVVIGCYLISK